MKYNNTKKVNKSLFKNYNCVCPTSDIGLQALRLTFDSIENANLLVGDASNVADWNTFFDLPTYGNPFTSVEVVGNEVRLFGGSDITLKDELFDRPDDLGFHLLEIKDSALCVVAAGYDCFGNDNYNGCPNLTTAIFPAMVTADDYCFSTYNGSLVNVDFSSLTTAGSGCFSGARFVNPDFPVLSPILSNFLFNNCINLTDSFSLLTRVTEAGNYCFMNCEGFINLSLPQLQTAGEFCFANCESLTTINLPQLQTAGGSCFQTCTSLTTISLPQLQTAGEGAFLQCTSVTTVSLPQLQTAGIRCFQGCTSLPTISLPLLQTTGGSCFESCTSLTTVDFPILININGFQCFVGCTSLTTINIPSCINLGASVSYNNVFQSILGNTITLTVPAALMTANGGSPDSDIIDLQANNTVTIITV